MIERGWPQNPMSWLLLRAGSTVTQGSVWVCRLIITTEWNLGSGLGQDSLPTSSVSAAHVLNQSRSVPPRRQLAMPRGIQVVPTGRGGVHSVHGWALSNQLEVSRAKWKRDSAVDLSSVHKWSLSFQVAECPADFRGVTATSSLTQMSSHLAWHREFRPLAPPVMSQLCKTSLIITRQCAICSCISYVSINFYQVNIYKKIKTQQFPGLP